MLTLLGVEQLLCQIIIEDCSRYRLADSVTIDAHKQLYIPMGAGMVLFKNPNAMKSIEHHTQYILRRAQKIWVATH